MQSPARVTYQRDVGGYAVRFRDVPEALTHGATKRETLRGAVDALVTALALYVETGSPIPYPSELKRGEVLVSLKLNFAAQILLYNELLAQQIRPAELARFAKLLRSKVRAMLDPLKKADVDCIALALSALGKHLEVRVG